VKFLSWSLEVSYNCSFIVLNYNLSVLIKQVYEGYEANIRLMFLLGTAGGQTEISLQTEVTTVSLSLNGKLVVILNDSNNKVKIDWEPLGSLMPRAGPASW